MIAIVDVGGPSLGLVELLEARIAHPDGFRRLRRQQEPVRRTRAADDGTALATVVLKSQRRRRCQFIEQQYLSNYETRSFFKVQPEHYIDN